MEVVTSRTVADDPHISARGNPSHENAVWIRELEGVTGADQHDQ